MEENAMNEFLYINEYQDSTANKRQLFGVRGMGPKYDEFWKHLRENYKPTYDSDDWPWSYLAFSEEDEKNFRAKYADQIVLHENTNGDPPYDCVLDKEAPSPENQQLANELQAILQDEIQKAINQEIIASINRNAR
jgi:hypothetical protein